MSKKGYKKIRTARPGLRHRRDNGPQELEIKPVPPPPPQQLGTLTRYTQEILAGGPRALIAARHKAAELSAKFGEEFEAHWCLTTPWLQQMAKGVDPSKKPTDGPPGSPNAGHPDAPTDQNPKRDSRYYFPYSTKPNPNPPSEISASAQYSMAARNRGRARFAMMWRPKYLAILALTRGHQLAARAAKVSINTVYVHRRCDPDFERQCVEAEEHAIELLHDVTMKSAIEGELEPIYWQGIEVGHVKKVDNRLRIEMLRAHMPKTFKTPGTRVAIATGNLQQNNFICGPEEQDELIALRREALERIAAKRANVTALPAQVIS